jgi:hypothetical protein
MLRAGGQCPAPRAACSDRQVFLRFLGEGFWHQPGRRVALAALVPTALVGLLWYFGTRTWAGNEQVTRPQGTILAAPLPLQRRELWNGGEPVRRLRSVHVAAALAVVAGLVAVPARRHLAAGRPWSDPGPLLGWLLLAGAGAVLLVAVATVLLARTARRPLPVPDPRGHRDRLLDRVLAANQVLALALVPAAMLYAGWRWPGAWEAEGALPGFDPATKGLFLVQVVCVLVLLGATWLVRGGRLRAGPGDPRLAFAGFGLPVVASMGWMLAGGFAAGLSLRVADLLGTPVPDEAAAAARSGRPACSSPCPTSGPPSAGPPWPWPWPGSPCAWSCGPAGWAGASRPRWPSSTAWPTTRGARAGRGWSRSPGPAAGPWPATTPSATPPTSTPAPWPWSSPGPPSTCATPGCPWPTGSRR